MRIAKVLIDKYWKGLLSVVEEKWLKAHHAEQDDKTLEAAYFKYLREKSAEGMDDPEFDKAILAKINGTTTRKSRQFSWMNWRVAAVVALLFAASITFKIGWMNDPLPPNKVVTVDTYQDPEEALEETKKALLFISTQLNKSSVYTSTLSKFNESQEKLKKE